MANILSLFDGMSCGMLAMMGAGVEVENYYAYEIDKYAIQTSQHNFPKIKQCGDVFKGDYTQYEGIDYLIGEVFALIGQSLNLQTNVRQQQVD